MQDTNSTALDEEHKECPFCTEIIEKKAIICRYCESVLPTVIISAGNDEPERRTTTKKKAHINKEPKTPTKYNLTHRLLTCDRCGTKVLNVTIKDGVCRACRDLYMSDNADPLCEAGKVGTNKNNHIKSVLGKKSFIDERIANEISKLREKCPITAAQSNTKKWHIRARDARENPFGLPTIIGFVFLSFILFSIFSDDNEPVSTKTYLPIKDYASYGSTPPSRSESYNPYTNMPYTEADKSEARREAAKLRQQGIGITDAQMMGLIRTARELMYQQ